MTKFVIGSGGILRYPHEGKKYFETLLGEDCTKINFLTCFFAGFPNSVEESYKKWRINFTHLLPPDIKLIAETMQVETIESQVAWADVIYLHGGSVHEITQIFNKYNLQDLFKGKIVGTNSASTLMIASSGWTCDERGVVDGLAVVPIKVGVHFYSDYGKNDERGPIDWEAARNKLEAYGDITLPLYTLKEREFIVVDQ